MKTEIKALYKKDPKLAKEVAKVLGFKIKAQKVYQKVILKVEDDGSIVIDFAHAMVPMDVLKKMQKDLKTRNFYCNLDDKELIIGKTL